MFIFNIYYGAMMIAVALCTNNRLDLLEKALLSVSKLDKPDVSIIFVLVDNDHMQSAYPIFERMKEKIPFQSYYFCEKNKGITFARNRALHECAQLKASGMAFFDDDAEVEPSWIANLYYSYKQGHNKITTGPQLSKFPLSTPDWAKKIIYFNPKARSSGSKLYWAATNNVLFPLNVYTEFGIEFDNTLRYSGGSDQCFFMQCVEKGFQIEWVADAIVIEHVPQERINIQWVKNRSFRYGSTGFFLQRKKNNIITAFVISLIKSISYITVGCIGLVVFNKKNELKKIESLCYIQRGIGWLSGIIGKRHQEYIGR